MCCVCVCVVDAESDGKTQGNGTQADASRERRTFCSQQLHCCCLAVSRAHSANMRPAVTNGPWSAGRPVCLSGGHDRELCARTADPIEMLFVMLSR